MKLSEVAYNFFVCQYVSCIYMRFLCNYVEKPVNGALVKEAISLDKWSSCSIPPDDDDEECPLLPLM